YAGKREHGGPDQRRGDIGDPKAMRRHVHHARDERDDGADGAEEAADEDALAAMAGEEFMARPQQFGAFGERPDAGNDVAEAPPEPVGDAVAEARARNAAKDQRSDGDDAL